MYGEFNIEYEPTKIDAYRRTITLNGDQFKIDILDTAGQECYQSIIESYLKNRDAYLIVFDLTDRQTFESIHFYWFIIVYLFFVYFFYSIKLI